jgi:hypothetical protein
MPAPAAIRIDGLDELRKGLRRAKDSELDDEMKEIHAELAGEILRGAEPNVPVRTGALLASLRSTGTVRDAIGRVGKKSVPYAPPIHWGHPSRGIRPNPFLRRAAERLEDDIVDRYDRQVAGMFERLVGR